MNIDEKLYTVPIIGRTWRRMHAYFKTQITVTDIMHVLIGLGIGMVIASQELDAFAVSIFFIGILYHLYAFIKGKPEKRV